jgi:hypothetical protein
MRFVAICLGSVLFAGCAVSHEETEGTSSATESAVSDSSCRWNCGHCPKGQVCLMTCKPIGHCGTTCTSIALCIEGYAWDDKACACVPVTAGGVTCGASTCAAGDVCCNSSCGICTPPGGMCTQQACTATSI